MANKRLREEMFETGNGLYDLGVMGAQTLREFDAARLPPLNIVERKGLKALA